MKLVRLVCLCLFLTATVCGATQAPKSWAEQFVAAQALERNGKTVEAIQVYAAIPGAEHLALRLMQKDPNLPPAVEKLAAAGATQNPRWLVLQGGALAMRGKRAEAVECLRKFASRVGRTASDGWANGLVPADYYPAQLSLPAVYPETECNSCNQNEVITPFRCGPGSYRDNLLLRFFVELEAWDDAAQEFARIWKIHQGYVGTGQFPGQSLQFALDYAFFLSERKRPAEELAVLLRPMPRLDLDHNPVQQVLRTAGGGSRARTGEPPLPLVSECGVTQLEFLRLAYEELQSLGKLTTLERALAAEIRLGKNAARLTLARLLHLEGKGDAAIQLEQGYLEHLHLSPMTKTYRMARMYELYSNWEAAAAEYEKLLEFPPGLVMVPDVDEFEPDLFPNQQFRSDRQVAAKPISLRQLYDRLGTVYTQANNPQKAFAWTLKALALSAPRFGNRDLNKLQVTAVATGQLAEFNRLVEEELNQATDVDYKIKLAWVLRDWERFSRFCAEYAGKRTQQSWSLPSHYRGYLQDAGPENRHNLIQQLAAKFPHNAFFQLELLYLNQQFESEVATRYMETLVEQDGVLFDYTKKKEDSFLFKNVWEVAEALLVRYAATGHTDKIQTLALRVARNQRPFFFPTDKRSFNVYQGEIFSQFRHILDVAIAQAAQPDEARTLLAAVREHPVERFSPQGKSFQPVNLTAQPITSLPGWANLPAGVRAVTGIETVLSLCHDGNRVYAGHPWGISIYDFEGHFLTRVALETAATQLVAVQGALWIGTPNGLLRMDCQTFALSHLRLNQGFLKKEFGAVSMQQTGSPNRHSFFNQVLTLAVQGDWLWIGTRRNIFAYHPQTTELRIFDQDDFDFAASGEWDTFWVDGRYVWATSSYSASRLCRFDWQTNTWKILPRSGYQGFIGKLADRLWVRLVDKQGAEQLGILNSETMEIAPVGYETPVPGQVRDFKYLGQEAGKLNFRTSSAGYFQYNESTGKLQSWEVLGKPIPQEIPCSNKSLETKVYPNGVLLKETLMLRCPDTVEDHSTHYWKVLPLPNGTEVEVETFSDSFFLRRFEGGSEWPFNLGLPSVGTGHSRLQFHFPGGRTQAASFPAETGNIPGDGIFSVLFPDDAGEGVWLSTNYGISQLTSDLKLKRHLGKPEGLSPEAVYGACFNQGKLALATDWEKLGLRNLNLQGGALEVYPKADQTLQQQLWKTVPPRPQPTTVVRDDQALPYLGGWIIGKQTWGGKTYVWGTRGLVVLDQDIIPPSLRLDELPANISSRQNALLRVAAETVVVPQEPTLDQFRSLLQLENPYVLARVLATAEKNSHLTETELFPFLVAFADHPHPRVRGTVLHLLVKLKGESVVPLLQRMAHDPSPGISGQAALETAKRGAPVEMTRYQSILGEQTYRFPVGESGFDYLESGALYQALASYLDETLLRMFFELPMQEYASSTAEALPKIAAALAQKPELLLTLFEMKQTPGNRFLVNYIFKTALPKLGPNSIPVLQQALQSPQASVRLQALRACREIAAPALVPDLVTLLNQPHAPQREIVAALAAIRTPEAIAALVELYRRERRGFQWSRQRRDLSSRQSGGYRQWVVFAALANGWPGDLFREKSSQSDRLELQVLIDIMNKLDPQLTQEFYRELAKDPLAQNRAWAAQALANCPPTAANINRLVLKKLTTDVSESVTVSAAVSLLLLDDPLGRTLILQSLKGEDLERMQSAILELKRAKNKVRLEFAQEALTQCAKDSRLQDWVQEEARKLLSVP